MGSSFRYRTFKAARRRERAEEERAETRAEKDFKAGKTIKDNPYRGVRQSIAWKYRFMELQGYKWVLQEGEES